MQCIAIVSLYMLLRAVIQSDVHQSGAVVIFRLITLTAISLYCNLFRPFPGNNLNCYVVGNTFLLPERGSIPKYIIPKPEKNKIHNKCRSRPIKSRRYRKFEDIVAENGTRLNITALTIPSPL